MIEHLDGIYETVTFQENLGIRINRLEDCEHFPEHWHSPIEIIRCIQNGYTVFAGEERHSLQEGDIAIIRPGTIHALTAPLDGLRIIYLADIRVLQPLADIGTLLALLPPVTVVSVREGRPLHQGAERILFEIEEEYETLLPFHGLRIYARLLELFSLLGRYGVHGQIPDATTAVQPSKHAVHLLEICCYINTHCTEDLTLDQISHLAGFSKFHFTRLFKSFTNATFYQYLNKKRIAHAEELLTNPDYSVTEVALHSGFSSLSAFIRMFRQLKGCTPSAFREKYSPSGFYYSTK